MPVVYEGFTLLLGHLEEGTTAAPAIGIQGADALLDLGFEGAAEVGDAGDGIVNDALGGDDPSVRVLERGGGTG
ncbi:hypothetical protein [Streptomyces sp. NPDC091215]|uniref:hypothetical protein n=1 Tax=Streptomyces sp. NPDC091215 TaxID=3155192 RepID=UPI00344AAE1F